MNRKPIPVLFAACAIGALHILISDETITNGAQFLVHRRDG
jgi:hypothetical protein